MLTLYKYELRKIVKKKMFYITVVVMLAGLLGWAAFDAVLPANRELIHGEMNGYSANRTEREAANSIKGRVIDQALLDEMKEAYEAEVFHNSENFDDTTEKALAYLDIYTFIGENIVGTMESQKILNVDAETFYATLNDQLQVNNPNGESFENIVNTPIVYNGYFDGWTKITIMMKLLIFMEIMFVSISLSTVFTNEHIRKTDQLILCTRFGKKKLYLAKILAGLTVALVFTMLLSLLFLGIISFLYGLEGFDTILQFVLLRPFNLSIGQAVLILFGLSFAGVCVVSILAMVFSELTKNSIATISVISGVLIVTLFITEMPANLRLLSEFWYLLPSNLVSLNGAFRYSMLHLGNLSPAAYHLAPGLYLIVAILFFIIGKVAYNRYQVSGR